jgi:hypothetical protein
MGEQQLGQGARELPRRFMTKKCPYCSTTLGYDETICLGCKKKVGEANEYGIAVKPGAWKAYVSALVAVSAFLGYLYYAIFLN